MNNGNKFAELMNSIGIKVHSAVQLGKFMHIDTNKSEEMKLRNALAKIGVVSVKVLASGADGCHLDGSRHHRLVAIL